MGESDKNQDEIKENPAGPEDKGQARDDDQYEKVCYIWNHDLHARGYEPLSRLHAEGI